MIFFEAWEIEFVVKCFAYELEEGELDSFGCFADVEGCDAVVTGGCTQALLLQSSFKLVPRNRSIERTGGGGFFAGAVFSDGVGDKVGVG